MAMGSSLKVTLWTTDEAKAIAAADRVSREFDRLESLLSIWKDGSDVVRLNAAAGRSPVEVSREMLEVLTAARMASEWTAGKFDITFGALADIWKFDHDQDNTVPDARGDQRAIAARGLSGGAGRRREGHGVHLPARRPRAPRRHRQRLCAGSRRHDVASAKGSATS